MHSEPICEIFGRPIYLYGICMAVGLIACFSFLFFAFYKRKFNEKAVDVILIIGAGAAAFGIFMAMVFQSLYDYLANPASGFRLNGNMTFQGGLIGGVSSYLIVYNLYIFVIAPRAKSKALKNTMNANLSDALPMIPIGIIIAHAFGRLGCFFGGCCYGKETDAWYGLPCAAGLHHNVVPVQLFECLFLVFLGIILAILVFKFKFRYSMGVYAVAYGLWRIFAELVLRDDFRGKFIFGLSPSTFWSIIMVLIGIGYFFLQYYVLNKCMKHPELQVEESQSAPEEQLNSTQE